MGNPLTDGVPVYSIGQDQRVGKFSNGEPTAIRFTDRDQVLERMVTAGIAKRSKRWPGRFEPVETPPACVPGGVVHREYAAGVTA